MTPRPSPNSAAHLKGFVNGIGETSLREEARMSKLTRYLRFLMAVPFVLLANVFDLLSSAAHCTVDRLAPTDEANGAR